MADTGMPHLTVCHDHGILPGQPYPGVSLKGGVGMETLRRHLLMDSNSGEESLGEILDNLRNTAIGTSMVSNLCNLDNTNMEH